MNDLPLDVMVTGSAALLTFFPSASVQPPATLLERRRCWLTLLTGARGASVLGMSLAVAHGAELGWCSTRWAQLWGWGLSGSAEVDWRTREGWR